MAFSGLNFVCGFEPAIHYISKFLESIRIYKQLQHFQLLMRMNIMLLYIVKYVKYKY